MLLLIYETRLSSANAVLTLGVPLNSATWRVVYGHGKFSSVEIPAATDRDRLR